MTSTRRLALALCLATCFSLPSKAQDYTTDNLIQSGSWQGCYTQTQTAIWGGGSGGPCPNVSLDGGIIFSYGQYTLSQNISINQALSAAGTGIQVTGYSYSWWVKNSNINGQQPGSYDWYTHINVDLLSPNGQILESDFYPYGYWIPNWTQFSGVRTYNNPYSLSSVDTIRLSVSGMDDGFWAGYYGPEYSNFNLRLNYSVDPCASDPLYSPTCPGYTQALLALTPQTETTTTTPMVEIVETNTGVEATPIVQQTQSTTQQTEQAQSMQSSGSGINISRVLNIIAREQARVGAVERSTVEATVEQSALQALQATQDAESIAAGAQAESISISISAQESSQSGGTASNFTSSDSASSSISTSGSSGPRGADTQSIADSQTEETRNDAVSVSGFSATDVLKQETNVSREETQREQKTETVRQNVPNNELAGNVTLASLGATPQGFQAYSITMPDSSFYAPKEIYRNQRTVDNPAGRRLFGGSDRMHQEMVDQQYKRN
jgi:hypothetical protein